MSEETEQSFSEVIRSALAVYDTILTEHKAGRKVLIHDSEGDKEIILPFLRS